MQESVVHIELIKDDGKASNARFRDRTRHGPVLYAMHLYGDRYKLGTTVNITTRLYQCRQFVPEAELVWTRPGDKVIEQGLMYKLDGFAVNHKSGSRSEVFTLHSDRDRAINIIEMGYKSIDFNSYTKFGYATWITDYGWCVQ